MAMKIVLPFIFHQQTLDEEKETDEKLTELAKQVNEEANAGESAESESLSRKRAASGR